MTDQRIDKPQAAVLVQNAHNLWIQAKVFVLTHEGQRLRKKWWFTQLARTTLIASTITVVLSAFGFTQDTVIFNELSSSVDSVKAASVATSDSVELPTKSIPFVWLFTGLSAVLAAVAKLGENHIGRPEDIQSHLRAELLLKGKMDSLNLLVARIIGYYDGTQSHDLQELLNQYGILAAEVGNAGQFVGVTPDKSKDPEAKQAIEGNLIDVALSRVATPEDLPDDAAGIQATVRGGAA